MGRASALLIGVGTAACLFACEDDPSPTVDAGGGQARDAGGSDAPVVSFCAGKTFDFCADFDDAPTPGTGWDGVNATGGGAVDLVSATDSSPPRAARALLPALDGSTRNAAAAQLVKRLPLAGNKRVAVELSARIGDALPAGDQLVSYVTVLVDGGSIGLFRGAGGWFASVFRDNAGADDAEEPTLTLAPPVGTWSRLRVEVDLGRPSGRLRVTIDGADALSATLATHGDAQPLETVGIAVGPSHAAGATPLFDVVFDDVTLNLDP